MATAIADSTVSGDDVLEAALSTVERADLKRLGGGRWSIRRYDSGRQLPGRRAGCRDIDFGTGMRGDAVTTELWALGALDLAERIAAGEISSREVIGAHLARIEAVNPSVNAVTVALADEAMAAAAAADQAIAAGQSLGSLHGVPFTVKENLDVQGGPTTAAVAAFRDNVAPADAVVVARMRAAGAIPVARTNLPDFALRFHTDNALHGATVNPWNPALTPGGSSGGEAVALATGMSPLGLGNDMAGSLRMPAQCTGICALKPSRGRVPWWNATDAGGPPLVVQLMAVNGPMARSVADLRAALAVISGPDPRDPWSVPADTAAHPGTGRAAVAVIAEPDGGPTHPQVAASVRRAADALAEAGYEVREVDPPPVAAAFETWSLLVSSDIHAMWPSMEALVSLGARAFLDNWFARWAPPQRGQLALAWIERLKVARAWTQFQAEYPLVLGPVSTQPPFQVGFDIRGPDETAETMRRHRLLTVANLVGLPSVAVPTGVADGVPQGIQVIGPHLGDELCLAAATAIEQSLGTLTPIDPVTRTGH
jgi:amidase